MDANYMISIIVPVYNMEKYLDECLNSILMQTFRNFEVILVDDGSTDRSSEICDRYVESYSDWKVIHKKNGGLSSARNAGIDIAGGEYVCFIDSDDRVASNYLEILYNNAVQYGADVSFCDYLEWDGDEIGYERMVEKEKKFLSREDVWGYLTATGASVRQSMPVIVAWGKLVRAELFQTLRFPEGVWHEDEFIVHRLLTKANIYVGSLSKLYFYRQRPDSITGESNKRDYRHLDLLEAQEERVRYCQQYKNRKLYVKMVTAYRASIIYQYSLLKHVQSRIKIRGRYIRSFLDFPVIESVFWKQYIVFLINPKWYYKKY